ncbi:hypothetical protein [Isoptericola sp. NPDC056578]|uniref:hypothetical protein n=1 Tax=unclassified Isoptericola TaxID=2623355 RepID=UPI0036C16E59
MGYRLAGISASRTTAAYLTPDQYGGDEYEDDTLNVPELVLTCDGSEQHIVVEGTDVEVLAVLDQARAVVAARVLTFAGGWFDAPVCPCGNDVECGGFLPADADGGYVSRRQGTPEPTHLLCAECGRYWTAPDPAVHGDRDGTEPRTIPGVAYAGQIDIAALAAANAAAD